MNQPQLRIYCGEHDERKNVGQSAANTPQSVTVPLRDIFPLLADAVRRDRAWLHDFEDEEITISADLHDVIMAYEQFCRPSA